ncbi:tape measure protein [Nosocomiicoccus sp. HMSC059G07]|uniref:phage tail protein n=1 Tax=Nosocomiicoccus sp. HMSC059G07 TaxID=1739531 RepID=UPI0008A649AB|nr:tape measure protein [Nosocomiicoccus sp. HMSC059G07]OFO55666.1 hypothetical protein HMPREF3029_03575 [Nosocomiicoccus sp. HMSC059G07]
MSNYTLIAKLKANSVDFEAGMKRAESAIANMQTKFESSMKKVSQAGENIKSMGDGLTNWITKPALGAATALSGIAIAGGFKRLVDIDTASAKLKALGYNAEEISGKAGIMDNALDSVRGTAFGMGDAVTTASGAIAAGIKPGKELTRYLSITADTAAIAGDGMAEIGSIMNKVSTSNKAYNNELQQLSDRGLPVYQWLAEEAGVTADAIFKMASDGEISSEMLLNSIEKNIGGAAQIMGMESFTASIANTWAAVSRLGAAFLDGGDGVEGFFSKMKPLIGGVAKLDENGKALRDTNGKIIMESEGLIQKIDKLAPMATELGNDFADGFQKVLDFVSQTKAKFDELSPPIQEFITKAAIIGSAVAVGIGPALKLIGTLLSYAKFLTPVFTALTGPIGIAVGVVALLASGFMLAWKHSETFRNGVMGLIDTFQNVFSSVGAVLLPLLQQIGQCFVQLGRSIVESVKPHLDTLSMAFTSFIGNIMPIIMSIVASVIPIFTQLGSAIMSIAQAVLPVLMSMFVQLIPIVLSLVETIFMIIGAIAPIVSILIGALVPVIVTIVEIIMNIVSSIFPLLVMAIQIIIDAIQGIIPIIGVVLSFLATLISGIMAFANVVISIIGLLISSLMLVITPIVGFVLTVISSIISIIKTVVGAVTSVFNTVFSIVSNIFSSIGAFIANTISTAISVISTITGHVSSIFNTVYQIISGVFDNVASKIQTVMAAIQGAWSGLTAFTAGVFDGVYSAVQSLVSRVTSLVNSVIGGINSAIGIINKIPGVSIGSIPYLYRGTDNWKGGAARMNEGGRGEIVILPSGSQVIPHDVSMKYAKESARNMMQNTESRGDFGAQSVQHELKVKVVPDADWIRGYIDEQNAIEATLQF